MEKSTIRDKQLSSYHSVSISYKIHIDQWLTKINIPINLVFYKKLQQAYLPPAPAAAPAPAPAPEAPAPIFRE